MAITEDEIREDLIEYADYAATNSLLRARSYLTAIERALMQPQSMADQGSSLAFDHTSLRESRRRVEHFISGLANTSVGGTRLLGVGEGFRG